MRTAAAQQSGAFDDEIAPMAAVKAVFDRDTKATSLQDVVLRGDEGNRPSTTIAGLQSLQPVLKGGQFFIQGKCITAGNASQLSDRASACVIMDGKAAVLISL